MTSTIEWHCLNTFLFSFPSCLTERYCYLFLCVCVLQVHRPVTECLKDTVTGQPSLLVKGTKNNVEEIFLQIEEYACPLQTPNIVNAFDILFKSYYVTVQPCLPRPSFYLLSVSPDQNLRIAPWWQTATCHQHQQWMLQRNDILHLKPSENVWFAKFFRQLFFFKDLLRFPCSSRVLNKVHIFSLFLAFQLRVSLKYKN